MLSYLFRVYYDGYPQFYDGIGMLRNFLDEAERGHHSTMRTALDKSRYLSTRSRKIMLIIGEAAQQTIRPSDSWSANENVSTFCGAQRFLRRRYVSNHRTHLRR